jgi:hypothetical protein
VGLCMYLLYTSDIGNVLLMGLDNLLRAGHPCGYDICYLAEVRGLAAEVLCSNLPGWNEEGPTQISKKPVPCGRKQPARRNINQSIAVPFAPSLQTRSKERLQPLPGRSAVPRFRGVVKDAITGESSPRKDEWAIA